MSYLSEVGHYVVLMRSFLLLFTALNCDDMLSVGAAGLLCSGINIPDPSDR